MKRNWSRRNESVEICLSDCKAHSKSQTIKHPLSCLYITMNRPIPRCVHVFETGLVTGGGRAHLLQDRIGG